MNCESCHILAHVVILVGHTGGGIEVRLEGQVCLFFIQHMEDNGRAKWILCSSFMPEWSNLVGASLAVSNGTGLLDWPLKAN